MEGACPSGYIELAESKGRAILSTPDDKFGTTAGSAYTTPSVRTHTHKTSSLCVAEGTGFIASASVAGSRRSLSPQNANKICDSDNSGSATGASTGYAYAFFRACVANLTEQHVPVNTIAHFAPTVKSCPLGWSRYTNANGRFAIPLTSAQRTKSGVVKSNSAAMADSGGSGIGYHNHGLSVKYKFPGTTINSCCDSIIHVEHADVTDKQFTINGATAYENPLSNEVPWISLLTCIATEDTETVITSPPPKGSLIYIASELCPSGYTEVGTSYEGRIILHTPQGQSDGVKFGGSPVVPPNGISHTHIVKGSTLNIVGVTTSVNDGNGQKKGYVLGDEQLGIGDFTSQEKDSNLPYIAISLCERVRPGPNDFISRGRWVRLNQGRSQVTYEISIAFSLEEGIESGQSTIDSFAKTTGESTSQEFSTEVYAEIEAGAEVLGVSVSATVGVGVTQTTGSERMVQYSNEVSNEISTTTFKSITQQYSESISIGCGEDLNYNLFIYELEAPGFYKSIPKPVISYCKYGTTPPVCPIDMCADEECTYCKPGTYKDPNFDQAMSNPKMGEFIRSKDEDFLKKTDSTGLYAGIGTGIFAFVAISLAVVVKIFKRKRENKQKNEKTPGKLNPTAIPKTPEKLSPATSIPKSSAKIPSPFSSASSLKSSNQSKSTNVSTTLNPKSSQTPAANKSKSPGFLQRINIFGSG